MKPKKDSTGNDTSSKPPPKFDSKPPSAPKQGKPLKFGESSSKTKKKSRDPCNLCGKDNHLVSRCWKQLEALEAAMQEHTITIP